MTTTPLSRTAAKAQAHRESSMYRQGTGWIVSTWSDRYGCNVLSNELPWPVARQAVADYRRERVKMLAPFRGSSDPAESAADWRALKDYLRYLAADENLIGNLASEALSADGIDVRKPHGQWTAALMADLGMDLGGPMVYGLRWIAQRLAAAYPETFQAWNAESGYTL